MTTLTKQYYINFAKGSGTGQLIKEAIRLIKKNVKKEDINKIHDFGKKLNSSKKNVQKYNRLVKRYSKDIPPSKFSSTIKVAILSIGGQWKLKLVNMIKLIPIILMMTTGAGLAKGITSLVSLLSDESNKYIKLKKSGKLQEYLEKNRSSMSYKLLTKINPAYKTVDCVMKAIDSEYREHSDQHKEVNKNEDKDKKLRTAK